MARKREQAAALVPVEAEYDGLLSGISTLLDQARRAAARTVNSILTATYYEVGRRVVEYEQGGSPRAEYGEALLKRLSKDLTAQHGRGFSRSNLQQMRLFYLGWTICQTMSGKLQARAKGSPVAAGPDETLQTPSAKSPAEALAVNPALILPDVFPLSWSHYVRLMAVSGESERTFYETEAIRGVWTVRQLNRQIGSSFFERVMLSRKRAEMLLKGEKPLPEDAVSVREEVRDPYVLEFLDLKDEYGEGDLEEALVRHLESFLLELGTGFAFVARQRNIMIGSKTYHIDLLLFHRVLRCLVVIDLKRGEFSHEDAGQMNLYLNYAREHFMMPGEADPIGLILCSKKDDAVVHYALGGIGAQVFASRYLAALPDVETLRREIVTTERAIELRKATRPEEPL